VILWYCRVTLEVGESFSAKGENGVPAVPFVTGAIPSLVPLVLAYYEMSQWRVATLDE
jgi:hypothetical protein